MIRKQNNGELQKIESVDNYINYLEKNILATYTDIGIDRDTFRVMKYFFDDETKRFKAKIEENGKTREKGISLNLLRNKISELEKKHIEIMKAELGAPGEKVYQKKDKGTLFTIKDYKIDRRTGNRRIVMETQQGGKRATFNYRDFWSSFAEIEDEKEDQERGAVQGQNDRGASGSQPVSGSSQAGRPEGEKGGQPEDQLEQVSVMRKSI